MYQNQKYIEKILKEEKEVVDLLQQLSRHSHQTYEHVMHTTDKMLTLYPYFAFKEISKKELTIGCLLHDIGKLDVPKEILNKQGKLTNEEWNIMKQHPVYGLRYLENQSTYVKNICLLHHEKLDGTGYPYGYVKELIPDYCQFIAILDIMDALCSRRSYRKACTCMEEFISNIKDLIDYSRINIAYIDHIDSLVTQGKFSL